jgi:uncharacterized protein
MIEHRIISSFSFNLTPAPVAPTATAILSPCIGICTLDAAAVCTGCHRSSDQIANWSGYSDAERARIMAALDEIALAS